MSVDDVHETLPRLRRLDIVPVQQGRQTLLALRDPSGLAENSVAVGGAGALVLQMLDGEHSVRQIQVELTRRTGQLVMSDQIAAIVRQLDEAHMLETPGLETYRQERLERFRAAGVRKSNHEVGYPTDAAGLAQMADGWLAALPERERPVDGEVIGAIAPHIDYGRGQVGYAHVYRDIAAACEADLFIILGTDHFGDTQFVATRNDFETPLGRVKTAVDVLERVEAGFVGDLYDGELQHIGEHTIELQVVLLQHFVGRSREFEIVPILCGGFGEELEDGGTEVLDAETISLVDCLREAVADGSRKVCVIASADLSHVGPRFGADRPLTAGYLEKVEEHDRAVLARAIEGDADGTFALVAARQNDTNICGLGPIYIAVKALGDCRRELLDYRQATSPERDQSVSFAAAVFTR